MAAFEVLFAVELVTMVPALCASSICRTTIYSNRTVNLSLRPAATRPFDFDDFYSAILCFLSFFPIDDRCSVVGRRQLLVMPTILWAQWYVDSTHSLRHRCPTDFSMAYLPTGWHRSELICGVTVLSMASMWHCIVLPSTSIHCSEATSRNGSLNRLRLAYCRSRSCDEVVPERSCGALRWIVRLAAMISVAVTVPVVSYAALVWLGYCAMDCSLRCVATRTISIRWLQPLLVQVVLCPSYGVVSSMSKM